jgi:hypothetical protein
MGHRRLNAAINVGHISGPNSMSALPPKADIAGRRLDVRFVPKADYGPLLSPRRHWRRNGEIERRSINP